MIGSPDEAVAASVTGPSLTAVAFGAVNAIVWLPWVTWKLTVTCGAAAQSASPAWSAVSVQVPTCTSATVPPLTVHTPNVVLATVTVRPDVAVGATVTVLADSALADGWPKVIVWASLVTSNASVSVCAGS
nr:hypothetical protein GCM10020063_028630 [Dactylosporangium thailandense]